MPPAGAVAALVIPAEVAIDENWLKHTLAWRDDAGWVRLGDRRVHLHPLSNEVQAFPPSERVY
jgi:succinate dehydrogenase / fumarate reductase, flavoprotein subunit